MNFEIYHNLLKELSHVSLCKTPLILAIDGDCGGGKTSLSQYLKEQLGASIIHMDHFFLPLERKTKERLEEVGGNIDYERFQEIILPALKSGKDFQYEAYNCQTASYDRHIEISSQKLIVIEGSYSLHKNFGHYYDFSVFLTVSKAEQIKRLQKRCKDSSKLERFLKEWIPMEKKYHNLQQVATSCDMIIDTSITHGLTT